MWLWIAVLSINAQPTPDSVKVLKEVPVRDYRMLERPAGSEAILLNRTVMNALPSLTAAELTSNEGSMVTRTQGPGMLTTSHFRGGQASQTATFWEGIPIGNAMLGQQDLALLPAALVGDVRLTPGSQGGTLGNQAVAGSLHFNQTLRSVQRWTPTITLQTGSWGQAIGLVELEGALKRHLIKAAFYQSQSMNDFPVKDYFSMIMGYRPQPNARQDLQAVRFSIQGPLQHAWQYRYHLLYTKANRQIPPTLTQNSSKAAQADASLRQVIQLDHGQKNNRYRVRLFQQWERLRFEDPMTGIFSHSEIADWGLEGFWSHSLSSSWEVSAQGSAQLQSVSSTVYKANLNRFSGQVQLNYQTFSGKLRTTASIRTETANQIFSGLQPYLGVCIGDSTIKWTAQVSGHFRYPTLNDLFWIPGGNPALKPESGWGGETGIEAGWHIFKLKLNSFYRHTENLIFWRPMNAGIWSPVNLSDAHAIGLELRFSWQWKRTHFSSTGQWGKYTREGGTTAMPYMPEWTISQWIEQGWRNWSLAFRMNVQDSVLDPEGLNGRLPGFAVIDVFLKKSISFAKQSFTISLMVRNLTDKEYQVIAWRAMPGRNWGIALQWHPLK